MAIEDRNLEPGTKLIAKYKKEEYKAEVIAGEDGKVKYRLADGREFKSPSSAGTAITNKACNGWAFWSVEAGGAQTAKRGARKLKGTGRQARKNTETGEQTPHTAGFRRVPKSKGRRGRRSETLLRRLPEEFHGAGGRTCRAVSRRTHIEWGARGNHRSLSAGSNNFICLRQVSQWSLPFALLHLTTNWSTSRGNHR